ncbi:hypothetical protein GCM10009850_040620 [Nonomuraea monospora]|uniref:Uncharacterized protein n=1 Tax=Nonomuraea monospora TaxID=568818 RepID=A0ABN3CHE3_9ACTN
MGASRSHLYGASGLAILALSTLLGYVLLAWGLRDMLTSRLLIVGAVAAVLVMTAGMALGAAITSGRPRGQRLIGVAAGAAIGAVCLLTEEALLIFSAMLNSL